MRNQIEYPQIVLNTTEVHEWLRWCSWLLPVLLLSALLACASNPPQADDAQRHETPAPTELSARTETPTAEPIAASLPIGTPPLRTLGDLLDIVPSEFSEDTLVFSFNDHESLYAYGEGAGGRAIHPEIASNIVNLNELMGLDFRAYEQGIWSWKPGRGARTFMAFQGPIEGQQTRNELESLGFKATSYMDTTYFDLHEDFSFDIRHQLRTTGLLFNRLALLGDSILAAPATGIMESLIEARQGDSQTLMASLPHSSLANAAGGELVSGAFFRPQWIAETWNSVNLRPPERLDRYRAGAEAWGTLSDYSLALLGYRPRENADEIVVALYYPASTDVEVDSQELAARWNNYLYDPSGPFSEVADVPLNQACSPFSVHITQSDEHSIIVGSCPIIRNMGPNSGASAPSLWLWLFNTRQLEFLAPNIEDLK